MLLSISVSSADRPRRPELTCSGLRSVMIQPAEVSSGLYGLMPLFRLLNPERLSRLYKEITLSPGSGGSRGKAFC